jgi:hypothetical protein
MKRAGRSNYGIQADIVQNSGTMSVGSGNTIDVYQTGSGNQVATQDRRRQLQASVEDLRRAIERAGPELSGYQDLLAKAERMREELEREKPSPLTLKSLLKRITDGAGAVTSVAGAITAVKALLLLL